MCLYFIKWYFPVNLLRVGKKFYAWDFFIQSNISVKWGHHGFRNKIELIFNRSVYVIMVTYR